MFYLSVISFTKESFIRMIVFLTKPMRKGQYITGFLCHIIIVSLMFLHACNSNRTTGNYETSGETGVATYNNVTSFDTSAVGKRIDMEQFPVTVLGIPYAGNKHPRQTLDIVYPVVGKAPYKTIVLFHGGGWMAGDSRTGPITAVFQAVSQGYAVVSVNYRLSDEVTWPKPLHDAKAAIRFVRANAERYNLDTHQLVVWGASAGGHIAEMLAATNSRPEFEDLQMGNENASSEVQGVVAWYAVSDVSKLTDEGLACADKIMGYEVRTHRARTHNANPAGLVSPQYPPVLLQHGTEDRVVPYRQSVLMQKKVNHATGKSTASLTTFNGATHEDAVFETNENIKTCLDFVDCILYKGNNPFRSKQFLKLRMEQ